MGISQHFRTLLYDNRAFVVIASIILVSGSVGIFSIQQVSDLTNKIIVQDFTPSIRISRINELMNTYRLKVYQQVASIEINAQIMTDLAELGEAIDEGLGNADRLSLRPEEEVKFALLKSLWVNLKKSYNDVIELSLNYAKEEALEAISTKNQVLSQQLQSVAQELIALKSRGIEDAYQGSRQITTATLVVTTITLLAGIIACLFTVRQYQPADQGVCRRT